MEHPVKADCDGRVSQVLTTKGDQVKRNQLLAEITTGEASEQESKK